MIYGTFSKIIKRLFKALITGKRIEGFSKIIYYEISQHLTFFFQRKIVYEKNVFENVKCHIFPGATVFDIGANIGQYALRFSELVGPEGKVICCEPDYKNYSFLQFNARINYCKNILPLNIGMGEKDGKATFFRDTETGGRMGSFKKEYVRANHKGFTDEVDILTYDSLANKYGTPDFVKVDVEGFEAEVTRGIIDFSHPTAFLIEVRANTSEEVFLVFLKHGYDCYVVDNNAPEKITRYQEIPTFANLLFIKP